MAGIAATMATDFAAPDGYKRPRVAVRTPPGEDVAIGSLHNGKDMAGTLVCHSDAQSVKKKFEGVHKEALPITLIHGLARKGRGATTALSGARERNPRDGEGGGKTQGVGIEGQE
jgi:hypothetical protein